MSENQAIRVSDVQRVQSPFRRDELVRLVDELCDAIRTKPRGETPIRPEGVRLPQERSAQFAANWYAVGIAFMHSHLLLTDWHGRYLLVPIDPHNSEAFFVRTENATTISDNPTHEQAHDIRVEHIVLSTVGLMAADNLAYGYHRRGTA